LSAQYLELRDKLLMSDYEQHLGKRLAFWANPSDKRLPIALLGRTLKEILAIPLDELMRFPSIGEKKFTALIALLVRVLNTSAEDLPQIDQHTSVVLDQINVAIPQPDGLQIDWSKISEIEWNRWQKAVIDQGLADESIGRLCQSLEDIPRVLWNKPFSTYCVVSLDELRSMKTHGEKRVHAILRLFHDVFEIASSLKNAPHLRVRLTLRWTDDAQNWLKNALSLHYFPSKDDVFQHLILPMLVQLRNDSVESVVQLAEARLGLNGPITSVRQLAKEMNIARARVYQILGDISEIMTVRWPDGGPLVQKLRDKCIREIIDSEFAHEHEQFIAAAELFYPTNKTGSDVRTEQDRSLVPAGIHEPAENYSYFPVKPR
ncbi:MAG: hypothetical protein ACRC2T_19380, partial [Thermoguttaceae bacterium]